MTNFRQSIATPIVPERSTALIKLQLTDEEDVELDKNQLSSLTFTLYVASKGPEFGQIINGRNAVDLLASCSSSGLVRHRLEKNDNVLASQRKGFETHVVLYKWGWAAGSRFGYKEVSFIVANQSKVT